MSADSATDAWAVGYYDNSAGATKSLITRWNGKTWTKVKSPSPGGASGTYLQSVSVVSPTAAWAVGYYVDSAGVTKALILHWNGKIWTNVKNSSSPNGSQLYGVSADSATDAWAAGYYSNSGNQRTLLVHWNGKTWTRVKSPNPDGVSVNNRVESVSALSPTDAWAPGFVFPGNYPSFVLRWNGKTWMKIKYFPALGRAASYPQLSGVSAGSAADAWAVGSYASSSTGGTETMPLLVHWNGKKWTQRTGPHPGGKNGTILYGVSTVSANHAWAVGFNGLAGGTASLILQWNGHSWVRAASPSPDGYSYLYSVSADSVANAWAVGAYNNSAGGYNSLILHWNGRKWEMVKSPNP